MKPRVLFVDIETSPSTGYYFDLYREGNIVRTIKGWYILSFAWRWDDEKTYHVKALCDYKGYTKDRTNDFGLVRDLWKVLDEADFVIGHNSDRFDLRKIRSRFVHHKLKPPSPFKSIDTLKIMRAVLAEDSNRLDAFARSHALGKKVSHQGFELWEECMQGNRKAWATMKRYNIHDVRLLVGTYKLIRPWAKSHPDLRLLDPNAPHCPTCLSKNVHGRGRRRVKRGWKPRRQCLNCGAWSEGQLQKV